MRIDWQKKESELIGGREEKGFTRSWSKRDSSDPGKRCISQWKAAGAPRPFPRERGKKKKRIVLLNDDDDDGALSGRERGRERERCRGCYFAGCKWRKTVEIPYSFIVEPPRWQGHSPKPKPLPLLMSFHSALRNISTSKMEELALLQWFITVNFKHERKITPIEARFLALRVANTPRYTRWSFLKLMVMSIVCLWTRCPQPPAKAVDGVRCTCEEFTRVPHLGIQRDFGTWHARVGRGKN